MHPGGTTIFEYHEAIIDRYPTVIGGVVIVQDMVLREPAEPFQQAYRSEQASIRARFSEQPLSQIEALAAWRKVFRDFGVKPTQYRSAAEALLRRLVKQGEIPSIHLLVDICNLVSIRSALPVAAFDLAQVSTPITVQFAEGGEPFWSLGEQQASSPSPGEVIFLERTGRVAARRWCWRQSRESATQAGTRAALVTVEGHHESARSEVAQAIQDLVELLEQYTRGATRPGLLDRDHRQMTA
jgi:DNA/RNA-binding domain of Phe-tRNA-synthetase-like protein